MRKQRLLVLLCSLCLAFAFMALPLMVVCAEQASPTSSPTKGPPITTRGYSIFDETIVDMTWPEVEKAAKNGAIILLPTGVIEQHGPHMSLGVDTYMAYIWSKFIRRELKEKGIDALIAPPFYWGMTGYRGTYPGSFSSRPETVKAVLYDTLAAFKDWGFGNIFVFSWHQEPQHNSAILEGVKEARTGTGVNAYYIVPSFSGLARRLKITGKEEHIIIEPSMQRSGTRPKYVDVHAGRGETGFMVAYFPDLVDIDLAKTLKSNDKTFMDLRNWPRDPIEMKEFMGRGYIGDPAGFDAESSKKSMPSLAKRTADTIESFIKGTYKR